MLSHNSCEMHATCTPQCWEAQPFRVREKSAHRVTGDIGNPVAGESYAACLPERADFSRPTARLTRVGSPDLAAIRAVMADVRNPTTSAASHGPQSRATRTRKTKGDPV